VGSLIIIIALFALLWVVMIRPQRSRQQKQREMLESVGPGDEVLTVGGLYGIVRDVDEDGDLEVEIAEGIRVRMAKKAVAAVERDPDDDETVDESAEADEPEIEGEADVDLEDHEGEPVGSPAPERR
jgi:preprotein translocase subunit YajC